MTMRTPTYAETMAATDDTTGERHEEIFDRLHGEEEEREED